MCGVRCRVQWACTIASSPSAARPACFLFLHSSLQEFQGNVERTAQIDRKETDCEISLLSATWKGCNQGEGKMSLIMPILKAAKDLELCMRSNDTARDSQEWYVSTDPYACSLCLASSA